ncbi:unnamed protein product [Rotaria socialis]|uniref:EF-hand domain-containing protein n=1 Tax=Rotaria socialis TaxID=392032 RepID=A0A817QWH0_9BILA|nr:unnamed protein product [Rotaria socialis]CAF3340587.1 unnamed protein product [Rotaria socialis]CAF3346838.1 unnamed protein product [Rotaria socialis]CAF4328393.1 unnamed protein product [Rotaria socialis]CAF4437964.1 unnamed protein product [Rotaria socialis]
MAERSSPQSSTESLNSSPLPKSRQSNSTIDSRRSSSSTLSSISSDRKHSGLFDKIETNFQKVKRRFSHAPKQLSEKEIEILLKTTNFSSEDIVTWHGKFLNDCPHGYMTRKEFLKIYKSLCPTGNADTFAGHIFRAFDLDRSNTIEFREFLIGLSMTSSASSPTTKLEWIFHVFDIDGNGLLTRDECLEVINIIVRFNQNQSSDLESSDPEQLVASAKHSMMRMFDNISSDRCNTLSMAQFIEGCQKDEFISQLLAPSSGN